MLILVLWVVINSHVIRGNNDLLNVSITVTAPGKIKTLEEDKSALNVSTTVAEPDEIEILEETDIKKTFVGDVQSTPRISDEENRSTGDRWNYKNIPAKLWPNGKVFYKLSNDFDASQTAVILNTFRYLSDRSCVRFVDLKTAPNETDFVYVELVTTKTGECSSHVGKLGGRQTMTLQPWCVRQDSFRTLIHETLHALGFWHEQNRPDRDDYVMILLDNATPGAEHNFKKRTSKATLLNTPYDYHSVMHYGNKYFSVNDESTIYPYEHGVLPLGNKVGMTETDVLELNLMYSCPNTYTMPCKQGYIKSHDRRKCIRVYRMDFVSIQDSFMFCRQDHHKGTLMRVKDSFENRQLIDLIRQYMVREDRQFWINLFRYKRKPSEMYSRWAQYINQPDISSKTGVVNSNSVPFSDMVWVSWDNFAANRKAGWCGAVNGQSSIWTARRCTSVQPRGNSDAKAIAGFACEYPLM